MKVVAAAGVAIVGLVLAWRALSVPAPPPVQAPPPDEILGRVEGRLAAIQLDTFPTPETVEDAIGAVQQRVRDRIPEVARVCPPERAPDLVEAVGERLRATLAPDFRRDGESRSRRGASAAARDPTTEERAAFEQSASHVRMAPLAAGQVTVRVAYHGGKPETGPDELAGFNTSTTTTVAGPSRMAIAEDPARAKLDIVEVRVPMRVRPHRGNAELPVIVGYQFGWNTQRRQWVPFAIVTYSHPAQVHYGMPL